MLPTRPPGYSPAAASLGLGGDALSQQANDETEEERKKRIKQIQERGLMGGSLATSMLFGGAGAAGL